ncbi:nucleotidyltransferase domain-containing protein [candidate division KSB1 bacterium]|nr:nucleotidyltransferase domain-containing protein [candidate division KSB1 bacterium]
MRLKQFEIDAIKSSLKQFDNNAKVYLFGSRIDDSKRGGDIDLLIISDKIDFDKKLKLLIKIKQLIAEQKIDLVVAKNLKNSFADYISEGMIEL